MGDKRFSGMYMQSRDGRVLWHAGGGHARPLVVERHAGFSYLLVTCAVHVGGPMWHFLAFTACRSCAWERGPQGSSFLHFSCNRMLQFSCNRKHGARLGLNHRGEGLPGAGKRRPGAAPVTGGLPAGGLSTRGVEEPSNGRADQPWCCVVWLAEARTRG